MKGTLKIITIAKQYALGLKSLPRATITPSSNIFLARGCFSLRRGKKMMSVSRSGTFEEQMFRVEADLKISNPFVFWKKKQKLKLQ